MVLSSQCFRYREEAFLAKCGLVDLRVFDAKRNWCISKDWRNCKILTNLTGKFLTRKMAKNRRKAKYSTTFKQQLHSMCFVASEVKGWWWSEVNRGILYNHRAIVVLKASIKCKLMIIGCLNMESFKHPHSHLIGVPILYPCSNYWSTCSRKTYRWSGKGKTERERERKKERRMSQSKVVEN